MFRALCQRYYRYLAIELSAYSKRRRIALQCSQSENIPADELEIKAEPGREMLETVRREGRFFSHGSIAEFQNTPQQNCLSITIKLTDNQDSDLVTKPQKLTSAEKYLNWKRMMKAYIRRPIIDLDGLVDMSPMETEEEKQKWNATSVKEKSTMILTLGNATMARAENFVDDDSCNAKAFWEALENYTSHQIPRQKLIYSSNWNL